MTVGADDRNYYLQGLKSPLSGSDVTSELKLPPPRKKKERGRFYFIGSVFFLRARNRSTRSLVTAIEEF